MKKRLFCYFALTVLLAFALSGFFAGNVAAGGKQFVIRIGTPTTKDLQVF